MTSPILSYDPEAKAIYLQLSENEVDQTIELSESVYVDVDAEGMPVGLEVLHAAPSLVESLSALPNSVALRDLMVRSPA